MATDVDALLLRIEASATKLEKDMAKARGTFDRQAKAMEKRADDLAAKVGVSLSGAVPDFSRVGAAAGATLASVLSVEAIGAYADKWRSVGNLIAAAGSETATLAATQSTVADIAERARTELEGTADLYARLTRSSKDLGASEAEVAVGTETVLKGLKISGASAAEAAATALQLSQALQSGVLGGDELRSLLEGAPVIAQSPPSRGRGSKPAEQAGWGARSSTRGPPSGSERAWVRRGDGFIPSKGRPAAVRDMR